MACRQDIRKKILDKVNEVFIEGRYTYYRVNDGTFRVANVRETRGKSRAKSLDQAKEIAIEVKDRIVAKYGNNVFVEVMLPQYVGFPVEIKVTPSELYVEKLFAKVLAEKRTEPISRLVFLQDPALYQQELMEDSPLKMIPYEAWLAQNKAPNPIVDENGQIKFFQRANVAETLNTLAKSPEKIENLKRTTEYSLLEQQDEDLGIKSGQAYMFLKEKDATRFSFLLEKHKQFPKEFTVTQKVTKYERDKADPLNFIGYNEYRDFLYVKSNNNKKSNLYNIIDTSTGELIAEKVRVLHLTKDAKEGIAKKYGLEFTPTEVFSPNRSIAFALYRQKPSKAKYIAQSKKYLYDALKFLNPEETGLKINLNQIETLLDAFPSGMWDYINTTYSPEDSTNINASISLQNKIKFKLPKLGLLTEIEKITGKKLQGVSFTNYDRSGGIQKVLGVDWKDTVTIDYKSMTTKQLRKAIAYYLSSTGYFKPSSEEENVRKYAEHTGVDYNKLRELVFGDFDKALDNIIYNQTGNSDTIELSKWRDSIRNYDWQMAELFSKPYEEFHKRAKEKVTEKFKDKKLSNGISHLDYFFSGNFNWLNINFNNISGQYYEEDMETQANVGVKKVVVGKINPFVMDVYKKPTPGKNFLKEQEVFNRLASILHEPFHALHALSYGTPEELELRKAFNNLYNTKFGKEMMNQVFGSGYRGEQISFDTLYKEFTAFATQLMLFPKEWIRKTDLRSNDIFEFIEKVQTLQDKTYEEIVRTKQKIGTTERIDTVEEKIKLTFLEKLYNFIASALNKVIPLSKKFFKTIADSKLVEKNIIEDVFGEVEETVTKVVKLPKDIEASKEEFLTKMDELKSAIMTLMQIDETMFSPKNIDNFFSQPAFYQETDLPTIKPGVSELFESNPELANAVYEALGFNFSKINVTDSVKDIFADNVLKNLANKYTSLFNNIESITTTEDLIKKLEPEIKNIQDKYSAYSYFDKEKNDFVDVIKYDNRTEEDKLIQKFYEKIIKGTTYISGLHTGVINAFTINTNENEAKAFYHRFGINKDKLIIVINNPKAEYLKAGIIHEAAHFFDNIEIKITNEEVEKIINQFEEIAKQKQFGTIGFKNPGEYLKIELEKGNNKEIIPVLAQLYELQGSTPVKEFNDKILPLFQITPQQKQQAQQLYSQYLDTIFPDSKVKDIVYHGSKNKFEKFDKSKLGSNTNPNKGEFPQFDDSYLGFHFTSNPNYYRNRHEFGSKYEKNLNEYRVLLNINNPKNIADKNDLSQNNIQWIKLEDIKNNDSIIYDYLDIVDFTTGDKIEIYSNNYVVFEPEQIHILGSKQDIEGFKQFAQTTPITPTTTDITEIPDVMAAMIYQNNNCK